MSSSGQDQPAQDGVAQDGAAPAGSASADRLGPEELGRYARHIILRELGGSGQRRLKTSRVLVVGAGGLGAPLLLYLAAAGVGHLSVVDDDSVSLSNLQRQILFSDADIGTPKVTATARRLSQTNPHIRVEGHCEKLTVETAPDLIAGHDLVIDGCDSFETRSAVNAACTALGIPLLSGAITQWEGQVALFDPRRGGPCYACIFPEAPADGLAPGCAEAGVVGALPGVVGSMMAVEAIKELSGITAAGSGASLRGRMLIYDGLWAENRSIGLKPREGCPVCGHLHG